LQRVLPADDAVTVELLVDDSYILLEVLRGAGAGDGFEVRFNEIPPGVIVDLRELLGALEKSRAWLIAQMAIDS
jgi:hypothetical protein